MKLIRYDSESRIKRINMSIKLAVKDKYRFKNFILKSVLISGFGIFRNSYYLRSFLLGKQADNH